MEPISYPNLALQLVETAELIRESMVDNLFNNNSVITGNLARSLKVQPIDKELEGTVVATTNVANILDESGLKTKNGYDYGLSVDQGRERGPGGMPPVTAIKEWIKLKRITIPSGFTIEQFAWVIAKNIERKGQRFKKPKPFIQPAIDFVNQQQSRSDNYGTAVALDIDNNIQQNWSEIPTST